MSSLIARRPADIAQAIRAAREDAGLTQAELAERLAIPRDYMVDLERHAPNIYAQRLFRVLHELGVTLTLTFGDDDGGA